jgi:hypothetical protein
MYKTFKPKVNRVEIKNFLNPSLLMNSALLVIKVGNKRFLHPEFHKRNTTVIHLLTEESFQEVKEKISPDGLLSLAFPYLSWDCETN